MTALFQLSDHSGTWLTISNNVLVAQPTLAFGKGWRDFDIQSTISQAISDQFNWSEAQNQHDCRKFQQTGYSQIQRFRCTLLQYFWPRNWSQLHLLGRTGTHAGWNQVMLTPGLILGPFQIAKDARTRPVNLIIGAGYQVAVTPNPVTQNSFVGTIRITF